MGAPNSLQLLQPTSVLMIDLKHSRVGHSTGYTLAAKFRYHRQFQTNFGCSLDGAVAFEVQMPQRMIVCRIQSSTFSTTILPLVVIGTVVW